MDDQGVDDEIHRMNSHELEVKAKEFQKRSLTKETDSDSGNKNNRTLLVDGIVGSKAGDGKSHTAHKKGAFAGVFVPTCENMWGVLIFLRFHVIVGNAGVGQALLVVLISFLCAFCTTSSMSATVSSGGFVSKGGPYYMISRALGPCVGASVGIMYWLAITMLAVLETLGAVEGILMAFPDSEFSPIATRLYGTVIFIMLSLFVYAGIGFISKLGIVFVMVVFFTLSIYYIGLGLAPYTDDAKANSLVTGLSAETLRTNWSAHYGDGKNFGYVLSVFFPCFTGILSGANRADILRDPPKNLRQGTFGAICFSLVMYSSYMVLWGMVADYRYLQGDKHLGLDGRRLAGAAPGGYIVQEIVFNPFPYAAYFGIIISSMSQALQCLVVAPRLLQSIAQDKILGFLNPVAPMTRGEPKRALGASYVVGACLVLLGQLDLVAPLLSMCFLVCYAFMNFSCFALTWLKSPAWRPTGIHKKRWRMWYMMTGLGGFLIAVAIMFTISYLWALLAIFLSLALYFYINWKLEQREWGSAMDGIRYQLALTSLIQLEETQHDHVNWRPQVLILYRIRLAEELKGVKKHGILRFYSQLSKGNGFCVVACVLETEDANNHAIHKAKIEKDIIKTIMKEESIQGFAEVVCSPSWREGTNYIIQLTGVGGLVPNTVLLDWPDNWRSESMERGSNKMPDIHKALDFVSILQTALAEDKAVLAIRGLDDMPLEAVHGTIDVWWMIHDGGFLILLSWLLVQHRTWRQCHLRIFAVLEGVSKEQAIAAGKHLTKILRARRLFYVDVETILVDDTIIQPYTNDWTLRLETRHEFLEKIGRKSHQDKAMEPIPLEINDLFDQPGAHKGPEDDIEDLDAYGGRKVSVSVSDIRRENSIHKTTRGGSTIIGAPTPLLTDEEDGGQAAAEQDGGPSAGKPKAGGNSGSHSPGGSSTDPRKEQSSPSSRNSGKPLLNSMVGDVAGGSDALGKRLNDEILKRSKRAELVIMNLPDIWGTARDEVEKFMTYCDTLTLGLDRVLFVHASGHEIFDIGL